MLDGSMTPEQPYRSLNLRIPGKTDINYEGNIAQSGRSATIPKMAENVRFQNQEPPKPDKLFGMGSKQEEFLNEPQFDINNTLYRPLENLVIGDYVDMDPSSRERKGIEEALKSAMLDGPTTFAVRLENAIEGFNYARQHYTVQNEMEKSTAQLTLFSELRERCKEGSNERLIGLVEAELKRHESAVKILSWALPYKAKYYSGFDTLGILGERGEQMALSNFARLMQGVDAKWLHEIPQQMPDREVRKWEKVGDLLPLKERGETQADRYGRYVADSDFWMRVIGEMNAYDPTIKGEKLNVSETMQQFLGDMLQRMPRILENGEVENIKLPTRKITVYLDKNGDQVPLNENGKPIDGSKVDEKHDAFVEVLDYYNNKARSEEEYRWVVSVISAMSVLNAKEIIDSLPQDFETASKKVDNLEDGSMYNRLFSAVQRMAKDIMDNYDIPPRRLKDQKIARSSVYIADAMAFASLDIAKRGFSHEWELRPDGKGGFLWHPDSQQGNPTASGDAFTAARQYFHEVVYQAEKNRLSANNGGILLPVDHDEVDKMKQVYLSEAAEANDRAKILERIKKGEQQHLAKYFGILNAFEAELGTLPAWQEGKKKRENFGKKVNPNLSKCVEEMVVFVPTPFKNGKGEKLIYPMLAPQHKVGLYDMLSVSKDITVADLLEKTWKKNADGVLVEASFEDGGRRLTARDVNWKQYGRYDDDGRAVNNNFMLQIFAPVYGAANPKSIEAAKQNPAGVLLGRIKAADIALRSRIKKFINPTNESGKTAKRASMELMHSIQSLFQELALGAHGLIGRDATERFAGFTKPRTNSEAAKYGHNLYTTQRQIEDFIPEKQGYSDYSDTACSLLMAMTDALEPITIASNDMAYETTKRFKQKDPTEAARTEKQQIEENKRT